MKSKTPYKQHAQWIIDLKFYKKKKKDAEKKIKETEKAIRGIKKRI